MTVRRFRTLLAMLSAPLLAFAAPASLAQPRIPLERHTVLTDDSQALTVWSKRPRGHERGTILLLHGRTWSALPNFDLHAGNRSVSLMDVLAAAGYAVYALDQRGYGATPRDSSGWLTPERAAKDASEVLAWIAEREAMTGNDEVRPALLGYSRGSLTAALAAQKYPERISALILYGFPLRRGSFSDAAADSMKPLRAPTSLSAAGSDFITVGTPAPGVKEAYVKAAVAADPIRADWKRESQFEAVDGAAIHVPVMLLNGERDPNVINSRDAEFFARLANVDRSWVVLANSDHVAHLERQREFVEAVTAFLQRTAMR